MREWSSVQLSYCCSSALSLQLDLDCHSRTRYGLQPSHFNLCKPMMKEHEDRCLKHAPLPHPLCLKGLSSSQKESLLFGQFWALVCNWAPLREDFESLLASLLCIFRCSHSWPCATVSNHPWTWQDLYSSTAASWVGHYVIFHHYGNHFTNCHMWFAGGFPLAKRSY